MTNEELIDCPDCGVEPGELHESGCDIEQCPLCGTQLISCCSVEDLDDVERLPWTGEWPGAAECREFGWYITRNPHGDGWIRCDPDGSRGVEDLNRLHAEARWDREKGRFVLPSTERTVP